MHFCISVDGRQVELIPNGAHMRVTGANRLAYATALEQYKRTEFVQQCEAIRQGYGSCFKNYHGICRVDLSRVFIFD